MGITVLSLFDGMSGCRLALRELGIPIDKYYASEIEKSVIKQTQLNFPDTIQLGSVTEVDARKLGHVDLLAGGSPCFAAGTKVLTQQGYKNIEDIRLGDMVLTHKNRWRAVVDYGSKMADTYEVQTQCSAPIVCTATHKFWARKKSFPWNNATRSNKLELDKPAWVEAQNLKGEYYVCSNIPVQYSEGLDISPEMAWVLGRYLADGHTRKDLRFDGKHKGSRAWQLILSIGSTKLEAAKSKISTLAYSCYSHGPSVYRLVFSNKHLVELAEKHCGIHAGSKFISEDIFNSAPEIKSAFLDGYLSGDGYINGNKVQVCTISHDLALGLQRLILDVESVHSNIYFYDRGSTWNIDGRVVNQKPHYEIHYRRNTKGKVRYEYDKIWFGVKKYTYVGKQPVYNITVDEDHSYTVENVVVKNCTDFSMAGTRRGMSTEDKIEVTTFEQYMQLKNDGYKFAGESYLFWEYIRILNELRETNPNILFFLENVEMGSRWESVFDEIIGLPGIHINSALVSAQNRRRIYWTNIYTKTEGLLNRVVPAIPQPPDRGIMLNDILEDEVDRKYYLKDEVVDKLLANGVKGAG